MSSLTTGAGPSPTGAGLSAAPVDLRRRRRPAEAVIKVVLVTAAVLSALVSVGIILALIQPVTDFFSQVPFGDFFTTEGEYAVYPLIAGTAMVTVIALLLAVPLGLGAAMYLSEYASARARKVLKPTVELLAGVPSVVYGFFALTFVKIGRAHV